ELNLDPQVFPPRILLYRIEQWKNQGELPEAVVPSVLDPLSKTAFKVYQLYSQRCLAANAVDFGDMLLLTVTLVRRHPDVRELLQARWSHILVDEYQDTNPVQYMLLRELVTPDHSLTVVGDDDQAI